MGLRTAADSVYDELHAFVWGKLVPDADGHVSEIERALSAIRGFSILGFFAVSIYGANAHPTSLLVGSSIALLGAAGAFAAGSSLGFLFGLPRWSDQPTPPPSVPAPATGAASSTPLLPGGPPSSPPRVRPNTGLEKVMDWLTTLIVGLGLVHLKDGYLYASDTSLWLTRSILDDPKAQNGSAGAAIVLAYLVAGFFLTYLWAQRYLPREMVQAERDSLDAMKVMVRSYAEQVLNVATDSPEERYDASALAKKPSPFGLDEATVQVAMAGYAKAEDYFDEPMSGFGPSSADGYVLEAQVKEMSRGLGVYSITLKVRATEPAAAGADSVVFFLHHTLPDCIRKVPMRNGEAVITILSGGSFIAGAAIAGTPTRLALDLAKLPGVSEAFRDN